MKPATFAQRLFETSTELHYSQTYIRNIRVTPWFETSTELHYSQTSSALDRRSISFETSTELHYSQTPNPKYKFSVPKLVQSPPSVIL